MEIKFPICGGRFYFNYNFSPKCIPVEAELFFAAGAYFHDTRVGWKVYIITLYLLLRFFDQALKHQWKKCVDFQGCYVDK